MFDAAAPDHWSYVFSLALEAPLPTQEGEVGALLESYYRGLLGAVAEDKGLSIDVSTVVAAVTPSGDDFEVVLPIVDAFGAATPVLLRLHWQRQSDRCAFVVASPTLPGSDTWKALVNARSCLSCDSAPSQAQPQEPPQARPKARQGKRKAD